MPSYRIFGFSNNQKFKFKNNFRLLLRRVEVFALVASEFRVPFTRSVMEVVNAPSK